MPAPRYDAADVHAGAPLLIRRADRAPSGALLMVVATLWLAAAIGGVAAGEQAIIPGFGSSGACLAGALGTALAVLALDWMVRGRIVVIGRGTVAVTVWSLLRRHAWREPLANYREIRMVREHRPHRYGARSWYVVRLWHPEPGKAVELARDKDPVMIERRAREYAGRCRLPLSWRRDAAPGTHDARRRSELCALDPAGKPLSAS